MEVVYARCGLDVHQRTVVACVVVPLLRASFVPDRPQRELRELTRYRTRSDSRARSGGESRCRRRWRAPTSSSARWPPTSWASRGGRCWRRWWRGPATPRSWPSWPGASCATRCRNWSAR